jgi:hypothetical protein
LKTVSRCGFGRTNLRADLIELALSLPQLTVDNVQTRDQRAHVDACRFSNAIRDLDGRFSQCTDNGLGIDATDAMLLEQLLNGGFAQLACRGRCGRDDPKLEKPRRSQVIG